MTLCGYGILLAVGLSAAILAHRFDKLCPTQEIGKNIFMVKRRFRLLRILTGIKHPKIKLQRLRKIRI